ncbi:MAG: hypothetical protein M0Z85_06645 [Gammaproteobacteria bacterium]|jgi:hypothetical protein|uniref:hypothetical protein n=1 Tax=Acidiferrobacter sp. SPIII_3 TaxID=1281578 RepID=UPI000D7383D4|nr:hypothetical protein [Acidiferrobacter sp. SPIII_3]AWP23850.1 hypothetical protein C4901_11365 [Acidiferrobacter sp. SPIII_3]MDA8119720.1 hypothetical protein [Gammaproteobacteria bacterium]
MDISYWMQGVPAVEVVVAAWLVLYLGRPNFHKGVRALSRLTRHPLRLVARFLGAGAADIHRRNRALLQAQARADAALKVEREWARLDEVVRRDVQGFPALHEALLRQVAQWEAEFQRSGEVPQPSPEWTKAVSAVARLKAGDDGVAERVQAGFQVLVQNAQEQALRERRQVVAERHRLLARAQLMWQVVARRLEHVDNRLAQVAESAFGIHEAVERYQALSEQAPPLDRALVASAASRLLAAGLVLLVAGGAALMNAHLIGIPLRWLGVGQGLAVAGHPASQVAAATLVAIEVVVGIVLFDALNVTHLFGVVAGLPGRTRRTAAAGAIIVLVLLAALQAVLAFVRESAVPGVPTMKTAMVPDLPLWQTVAEGLLAFVLPCLMALVAIPLEAFIYALRTISGVVLEALVRILAFGFRLAGRTVSGVADTLSALYDLFILPPLLLERAFQYGAYLSAERRRGASQNR